MKLIVLGSVIIAASSRIVDDGINILTYTSEEIADGVFPKAVIAGYSVEDTELPADFSCQNYAWINGALAKQEPAEAIAARKAAVAAQIDQLERDSMMNRGVREITLRLMEQQATTQANGDVSMYNQILSWTPAYTKFKALDDQIAQLRRQL